MLDHNVIPPPTRQCTRTVRVIIDSRHRDLKKYPNAAQYELDLEEDLKEVVSAELMTASVPLSAYMIPSTANKLTVVPYGASNPVTVQIPAGDYTPSGLAFTLSHALTNTVPSQDWDVVYSESIDRFLIKSASPFTVIAGDASTLKYAAGSIARHMGFDRKVYNSVPGPDSHTVVTTFRPDMDQHLYAVLHMKHVCLNRSSEHLLNKSFALFAGESVSTYNFWSPANRLKKSIRPFISNLSRVSICFKDRDGNLYDFQNKDHVLEVAFEVSCHTQSYAL